MESYDWGRELPTLSGPRLTMRMLTQADAPEVFGVFGDPEVMRFWSSPPLPDVAGARELIDQIEDLFKARRLFQWGVCSRDTGKVTGTCTLHNLRAEHRRAEIGFAIARANWGQGFATEALELLIGFAFATLGLHRLEADTDPENVRSLRLLERQGFKREGYLRERWHHLGKLHDGVFLGLLASEWAPSADRLRVGV
jgi:[ribosomal protein S5]-alanine N-acetyltransferase